MNIPDFFLLIVDSINFVKMPIAIENRDFFAVYFCIFIENIQTDISKILDVTKYNYKSTDENENEKYT